MSLPGSICQFFLASLACVSACELGGGDYRIDFADGSSRRATKEEIKAASVSSVTALIYAEAQRRIDASFPAWKRTDLNSRALEILMNKTFGIGTAASGTEVEDLVTLYKWTQAVNKYRDEHIRLMTASDDPLKYDFSTGWPE